MDTSMMMKVLRHRRHLSQLQCAEQIGVAAVNYGRRERGEADFSISEVAKLLNFMKFDSGSVFDGFDLDVCDRTLQDPRFHTLVTMIAKLSHEHIATVMDIVSKLYP